MSWREAQTTARELHAQLRAKHSLGYLFMVLRAWLRILDAEDRAAARAPDSASKTRDPKMIPTKSKRIDQ